MQPNVFIGGVGGSGTRILSQIAQSLGINMGADFNKSQDTLWFSIFFLHREMMSCSESKFSELAHLYAKAFTGTTLTQYEIDIVKNLSELPNVRWKPDWGRARADSFLQSTQTHDRVQPWGWKEPNSHVFAERFLEIWPKVNYLHMWRDGIDMSLSNNQLQLKFWGGEYLRYAYDISKKSSLAYWVAVHKSIIRLAKRFPGRVGFLNFEDLCKNPYDEIKNFVSFADLDLNHTKIMELCSLVSPPQTIGRGNDIDISEYDLEDYNYALGFKNYLKNI